MSCVGYPYSIEYALLMFIYLKYYGWILFCSGQYAMYYNMNSKHCSLLRRLLNLQNSGKIAIPKVEDYNNHMQTFIAKIKNK